MNDTPRSQVPKPRRQHTKEFKEEAVKLALREDVGFTRAAEELGVHPTMLYRWWKRSQKTSAAKPGGTGSGMSVEAELEAARRRIRVLEMERDILKKAAAFFAKEQP
jgi:transposase